MSTPKIIFITGTDTGVGKTLMTALLLEHLRHNGVHALAMKPFCSGGVADVKLLQSLQRGELTDSEMNPFYFEEPIAPYVAAKKSGREIRLNRVIARIHHVSKLCECLLVEGSGGLMVPLGRGFTVASLIANLDCHVIVVARNSLGTINHTLLTMSALQKIGKKPSGLGIVLMDVIKPDFSSVSNGQALAELLRPITVTRIPNLGVNATSTKSIKSSRPKVNKLLKTLLGPILFPTSVRS